MHLVILGSHWSYEKTQIRIFLRRLSDNQGGRERARDWEEGGWRSWKKGERGRKADLRRMEDYWEVQQKGFLPKNTASGNFSYIHE